MTHGCGRSQVVARTHTHRQREGYDEIRLQDGLTLMWDGPPTAPAALRGSCLIFSRQQGIVWSGVSGASGLSAHCFDIEFRRCTRGLRVKNFNHPLPLIHYKQVSPELHLGPKRSNIKASSTPNPERAPSPQPSNETRPEFPEVRKDVRLGKRTKTNTFFVLHV